MTDALARQESVGLAAQVDIAAELPQIFALASKLIQARGFIPEHFKGEGEIVAALLAGRELGLQPMVSLRSIYLVKGKVTIAADVMLGLMISAGIKFQWLEQSDKVAKLRLERRGFAPHEQAFTIEDAQRAGLVKDGGAWKAHPAAMLRARCVSAAGRAYAPDILSGVYVQGELDDVAPVREVKARRTLDDVAGVSREQGAIDAGMSDHAVDAARHEDEAQSRAETRVEHNADGVVEQEYTLTHHMAALTLCGVNTLGPWIDALQELRPTEQEKTDAWTAFKGRCAELGVDPKTYSKKSK